ncbi:hypothetical protein [Klebsiella quasipneumoniae]|uniref:hypothetical protein n=1 Tax=Klebsiella quasipneumoniae TaxID=1463165 RepID=UPI00352AB245
MAKVHEELSAGIRFGGTIDPSWTKSLAWMQKGIEAIGKESAALAGEQAKLRDKMRIAALKGKTEEVKKLTAEYEKLKKKSSEAADAEAKLTKKYERRQSMDRFRGKIKSAGAATAKGIGYGAMGAAGGLFALGAGVVALNAETAEKLGQAKSYGIDAENYLAMGKMAKGAGLNDENVGDLHEEYKNKLNDYRDNDMKKGDLYDVLTELGYKAHEFAGMNNEEQVASILDRLSKISDPQKAAALADKAFGGEGNKFVTWLRSTGKGFTELLESEKKYILLNKEGMAEAEKGRKALSDLWTAAETAAMQVAGMTLGALSGYIGEATTSFADWSKNGGLKRITDFIVDDAIPAGAALVKGLYLVSQVAYGLAKKLSFFIPDEKDDREDILKALVGMGKPYAEVVAEKSGQGEWFSKIMQENPNLEDDLRKKYNAAAGFFADNKDKEEYKNTLESLALSGSFNEKIDSMAASMRSGLGEGRKSESEYDLSAPAAAYGYGNLPAFDLSSVVASAQGVSPRKQVHNEVKPTINVYQMPGEDANALAQRTAQEVIKPFESGMFDPAEVM